MFLTDWKGLLVVAGVGLFVFYQKGAILQNLKEGVVDSAMSDANILKPVGEKMGSSIYDFLNPPSHVWSPDESKYVPVQ